LRRRPSTTAYIGISVPTEDQRFQSLWRRLKRDGWLLSRDQILLPLPVGDIIMERHESLVPIGHILERAREILEKEGIAYEINVSELRRDRSPPMSIRSVAKLKVVLIGDSGVGKTSLVKRFVLDQFDDRYLATMGAKVTKKELLISRPDGPSMQVDMIIWDVMGQKNIIELSQSSYFIGAQGIIAVCDVTNRRSLTGLEGWINGALYVSGDVPVHILINKMDLSEETALSRSDIARFSRSTGASFALVSAKSGTNVEEAFVNLAARIVRTTHRDAATRAVSLPGCSVSPESISSS